MSIQKYVYVCIYINMFDVCVCTHLVSLFNGISTYVGYIMSKLSLLKNSGDTI